MWMWSTSAESIMQQIYLRSFWPKCRFVFTCLCEGTSCQLLALGNFLQEQLRKIEAIVGVIRQVFQYARYFYVDLLRCIAWISRTFTCKFAVEREAMKAAKTNKLQFSWKLSDLLWWFWWLSCWVKKLGGNMIIRGLNFLPLTWFVRH